MLFNLFLNKTPEVINLGCDPVVVENVNNSAHEHPCCDTCCDPVEIGNNRNSTLMWCDDLVVFSRSAKGLQNAINRISQHFKSLGLSVNKTKTKVVIFNNRGISLSNNPENIFFIDGARLDVVNEYQYLGLKLKSSGSFNHASNELYTKASRSYFSISNILYSHKKWPVNRALSMFDTIVSPVCLYASEVWSTLVLPTKSFKNLDSVLKAWETFQPELLNQKVCRMVLGVHRKAARYAVLGELGRFPLLFRALTHTLKYEWYVSNKSPLSSLVYQAVTEMKSMTNPNSDCWYYRVKKLKTMFQIPDFNCRTNPDTIAKKISNIIESKFSLFWKQEISRIKLGPNDTTDRNKLRFYKTLKSSFSIEPYISSIQNRNQRAWISRIRLSAHRLCIETGRYTQPITPVCERVCKYCETGSIDDENHLINCPKFSTKTNCLFGKISAFNPEFLILNNQDKILSLLCPVNPKIAKLFNKYIGIIFNARTRIDNGEPMDRGLFSNTDSFLSSESDDSDMD